jgi:hypothetical protein
MLATFTAYPKIVLKTFLAIQYSYAYYYSNIACSSGDESNVKICHNVDATK